MHRYTIAPLTKLDIDRAFPLVQLIVPGVRPERWRAYALSYLRRPVEQGILAAFSGEGHISGLANYRRTVELESGITLICDRLMCVDLVDPASVTASLIEALRNLAVRLSCARLRADFSAKQHVESDLTEALPPSILATARDSQGRMARRSMN